MLGAMPNLSIMEAAAEDLVLSDGRATGVVPRTGSDTAGAVVLTTGTFLNGLIHIGERKIARAVPLRVVALTRWRVRLLVCPKRFTGWACAWGG